MKTIVLTQLPKLFSTYLLLFSSTILFAQVGIGTLTPETHSGVSIDKFNVTGTGTASGGAFTPVSIIANTGAGAALGVQNDLTTNTSPAMEVANAGATGIALRGLHLDGTGVGVGVYGSTNSASGWGGYFAGRVYASGGFWAPSELKWKENIRKLDTNGSLLDKLMLLQPKSYNWKSEAFPGMSFNTDRISFGFIAQELKEVFPELVLSEQQIPDPMSKNEPYKAVEMVSGYHLVNYSGLIPILTGAVQEQQQIIRSQEQRIAQLENALNLLEQRVNELNKK